MGQVVYGLASGENQAETIVQRLYENGVPLDAVSVLVRDSRGPMLHPEPGTVSPRQIAALAIVPMDGVPGFLGAGEITSRLQSKDIAAGLRDGLNMPAGDSERYERELRVGKILIAVKTDMSVEHATSLKRWAVLTWRPKDTARPAWCRLSRRENNPADRPGSGRP